MNLKQSKALALHFEAMHNNPPAPFNTSFSHTNKARWHDVILLAEAQAKREELSSVPAERLERLLELRAHYDSINFTAEDVREAVEYYWEA